MTIKLDLIPIVEGHGEVTAVPSLLHRIAADIDDSVLIRVNHPIRVKSGSFLNDEEYFFKQIALAAAKAVQFGGFVLILIDCEDQCPAELGPIIKQRAINVRGDVDFLVVLAYREYETWFIQAVASLAGKRGLPDDIAPPEDPESIRDAKGWLSERMDMGYDPVVHQLEFTREFDLVQAQQNHSFRRLFHKFAELLDQVNC